MDIAQAPAATEPGPRSQRIGPSVIGAVVALALALPAIVVLEVATSSDGNASALGGQPVFVGICLAVSATLGWQLGSMAARGGWWLALGSGIFFGICWPPITMLVSFSALIVDAVMRGVVQLSGAPATLGYLIYGVVLFWIVGAVYLVPAGVVWAFTTHSAWRLAGRGGWQRGTGRSSGAALVLALVAITAFGGTATALTYSPWATRCLDLPGGARRRRDSHRPATCWRSRRDATRQRPARCTSSHGRPATCSGNGPGGSTGLSPWRPTARSTGPRPNTRAGPPGS